MLMLTSCKRHCSLITIWPSLPGSETGEEEEVGRCLVGEGRFARERHGGGQYTQLVGIVQPLDLSRAN